MLIVISDLHFVDQTAGAHNIPPDAFREVFLDRIVNLAERKKAQEIKLLLLGDIPDLIRTTRWFEVEKALRPWGEKGLQDVQNWNQLDPDTPSATEQVCLEILEEIYLANQGVFQVIHNFPQALRQKINENITEYPHLNENLAKLSIDVIYVPGNHDRLCNLYPSVRSRLANLLNLTCTAETIELDDRGNWWYRNEFIAADYGVYARHGHEYDAYNYAGSNRYVRQDHLQVPVGDIIATEMIAGLPYIAEKYNEPELKEKLEAIDDVRPLRNLGEWFHTNVYQKTRASNKGPLLEIFEQALNNTLSVPYAPSTTPAIYRFAASSFGRGLINFMLKLLGAVSITLKERLLFNLAAVILDSREKEPDEHTTAAFQTQQTNNQVRYVVYGHTHRPKVTPLAVKNNLPVIYINTGTWRDRWQRTVELDRDPNFVAIKHMTYAVFYRADEDRGQGNESNKAPGTVSMDVWDGFKQKLYREELR